MLDVIRTNQKKAIKKAGDLLKEFHTIRRLAGEPIPQRLTSSWQAVHVQTSPDNTNERRIIQQLDAKKQLNDIYSALNTLDDQARRLLWLSYIDTQQRYKYEIYEEMCISKTSYYTYLNQALLQFAEAYNGGELFQ
ncbi:MAG: ArpU family phage packaging/lysis transcriptional regulator [Aerococcus sp.]|nr:ArpU family phage packaging/lysis transcriptional regulator [Aerococcus sp.]